MINQISILVQKSFHDNYLISFIRFDTMNEKKGGKNETIITSIILGRNCFDSAFMADVVFWARNRNRKTNHGQYRRSDIKDGLKGSSRRTLGYFCRALASDTSGVGLYP